MTVNLYRRGTRSWGRCSLPGSGSSNPRTAGTEASSLPKKGEINQSTIYRTTHLPTFYSIGLLFHQWISVPNRPEMCQQQGCGARSGRNYLQLRIRIRNLFRIRIQDKFCSQLTNTKQSKSTDLKKVAFCDVSIICSSYVFFINNLILKMYIF
jgi:hypothetical protein